MEKIKQFIESDRGKDIFTVLIVILVGLSSFGLGRLSKSEESAGLTVKNFTVPESAVLGATETSSAINTQKPESVEKVPEPSRPKESSTTSLGKGFFASKRGQKYYPVGCSAGQSLKQENRIYFSSKAEAEEAGYEMSTSCK